MNIPDQPIAMSHQIHAYTGSGSRFTTICGFNIPNGSSQMATPPTCGSYEARLMELLDPLTRRGFTEYSA